jgi:hypothetical protein
LTAFIIRMNAREFGSTSKEHGYGRLSTTISSPVSDVSSDSLLQEGAVPLLGSMMSSGSSFEATSSTESTIGGSSMPSNSSLVMTNYTLSGALFFLQSYFRSYQSEKEGWDFERVRLLEQIQAEKRARDKLEQEVTFLKRRMSMLEGALKNAQQSVASEKTKKGNTEWMVEDIIVNTGTMMHDKLGEGHLQEAVKICQVSQKISALKTYLNTVIDSMGVSANVKTSQGIMSTSQADLLVKEPLARKKNNDVDESCKKNRLDLPGKLTILKREKDIEASHELEPSKPSEAASKLVYKPNSFTDENLDNEPEISPTIPTLTLDFDDAPIEGLELRPPNTITDLDESSDDEPEKPVRSVLHAMRAPSNLSSIFDNKCILRGHLDQISQLHYCTLNDVLISTGMDGWIKCWYMPPGSLIGKNDLNSSIEPYVTLHAHSSPIVASAVLSPASAPFIYFISVSDDLLCIWNLPLPHHQDGTLRSSSDPYDPSKEWLLYFEKELKDLGKITSLICIPKIENGPSAYDVYILTHDGKSIHRLSISISHPENTKISTEKFYTVTPDSDPWVKLCIDHKDPEGTTGFYALSSKGKLYECSTQSKIAPKLLFSLPTLSTSTPTFVVSNINIESQHIRCIFIALEKEIFILKSNTKDPKFSLRGPFIAHSSAISIIEYLSFSHSQSSKDPLHLLFCGASDGSVNAWDISSAVHSDIDIPTGSNIHPRCTGTLQAHRTIGSGVTSISTFISNQSSSIFLWTAGSDWLIKLFTLSLTAPSIASSSMDIE